MQAKRSPKVPEAKGILALRNRTVLRHRPKTERCALGNTPNNRSVLAGTKMNESRDGRLIQQPRSSALPRSTPSAAFWGGASKVVHWRTRVQALLIRWAFILCLIHLFCLLLMFRSHRWIYLINLGAILVQWVAFLLLIIGGGRPETVLLSRLSFCVVVGSAPLVVYSLHNFQGCVVGAFQFSCASQSRDYAA